MTTGIGNAINTDKPKGDFGASYLGALGGTFVGLALGYFIDQAFPKGQSYLLAWVFLSSFGGAVAGYMLSIPESATGSGASNSATNIRYLQLGAMSF
ncbi:MAG: hypothetical protein JNJ69_14025 [Leptospiraceae bacterium]|nr:hypothetical protein [Leptospiraceae bacterium]